MIMEYTSGLPLEDSLPLENRHVYKYTPARKISDTATAMASVEVYNYAGDKIGEYAFSRSPKSAFDERVENIVHELIREHEQRKIFNSK